MPFTVAIIGSGPAGLVAAEILSAAGLRVDIYERMPSPARKFLMAGRGGLNLTHSEPFERFVARYGKRATALRPALEAFPPSALRAWADSLGAETFVGSSGRVFPKAMKASPLLRAWLARLEAQGVRLQPRSDWQGFDSHRSVINGAPVAADATLLALGGASWPRLGGDGGWAPVLADRGVALAPFQPANAGFRAAWSDHFARQFAGEPLKNIALRFGGRDVKGEIMLTRYGLEGGAIYALSGALRDAIARDGFADLIVDLKPELDAGQALNRLKRASPKDSHGNRLRKSLNLSPAAIGLLKEVELSSSPPRVGEVAYAGYRRSAGGGPSDVKSATLRLTGMQGLDRAISTAGGIKFDAMTPDFELKALPGVYAVGEMLDWEAPTGGYLLQACFATAVWAAKAIIARKEQS